MPSPLTVTFGLKTKRELSLSTFDKIPLVCAFVKTLLPGAPEISSGPFSPAIKAPLGVLIVPLANMGMVGIVGILIPKLCPMPINLLSASGILFKPPIIKLIKPLKVDLTPSHKLLNHAPTPLKADFIPSQSSNAFAFRVSQFFYRRTPTPIKAPIPSTTHPIGDAIKAALSAHCAAVSAIVTPCEASCIPFKATNPTFCATN